VPPTLALILCLVWCIYVLSWECRHNRASSVAIWLAVLWMIRCASRSLGFWMAGDPSVADPFSGEGSLHDRVFLGGLMMVGAAVLIRRPLPWGRVFSDNRWLLLFFAYMALSVLWSETPGLSWKRWIRTAGDLLFALLIATERNPLQGLAAVIRRSAMLLIPFSLVLAKYYGPLGRAHDKHDGGDTWIGVATHKNALGALCLVAALYFLWHLYLVRRGRAEALEVGELHPWMAMVYLGMIAILFAGGSSPSMTSLLVFVLTLGAFGVSELSRGDVVLFFKRLVLILGVVVVLHGVSRFVFDLSVHHVVLESLGRSPSLTDRLDIWPHLIDLSRSHAILGSGFGAFWTESLHLEMIDRLAMGNWAPAQAHNGYLEVYVHLGVLGLLLFAFVLLSCLRGAFFTARFSFEYGRARLILLLAVLMYNYAESAFTRPTHLMWFLFLLAAIHVPWNVPPALRKGPSIEPEPVEEPLPALYPVKPAAI
jgi:exopolysaccharide production protein ExoQ